MPCRHCGPWLKGRYSGCENDIFLSALPVDGLLRRHFKHKAMWCHNIGEMGFENGALLEPSSVALAGVKRAGVGLGDPTVFVGLDLLGL
jgi:L-iditol 2-dehydrogenase